MRRTGHIPWFGIFLAVVTLAFETATHFRPGLYPSLQRHFALSWDSLEEFQFHRILLSAFIQTSAGYSTTIFGLTSVIVPGYEFREGTRRALTLFFLGDWLSTLSVLVVLKVAGDLGNGTAARLASEPDSGSSAGGFACLGALILGLPPRYRLVAIAALAGFFAVRFTFWHRLFDFQHALASLVGMALWAALEYRQTRARPAKVPS